MLTMLMSDDVAAVKKAVDATSGLVRDHATEIDQTRRLPDGLVSALRRTGINRMFLPTVLGGLQAPVADVMDMIEGIAAVDGSTAWCTVIGAGSNVFAGYMPEAGARQVFADPDQGNATMLAPVGTLVADGNRRAGSAGAGRSRATACTARGSAWARACIEARASTPSPGWRSCRPGTSRSRTRGTSSGSGAPGATTSRPGAPSSSSTGAAPSRIGRGRRERCGGSRCTRSSSRPWRRSRWASPVARSTRSAAWRSRGARPGAASWPTIRSRWPSSPPPTPSSAELGRRCGKRSRRPTTHAERGDPVDRPLQARVLLASVHASDASVTATSVAHQLGGGAATYVGNPLLRALGDVQASRQHLLFSHKHLGELAKVLAGLDVNYPPYIM